MNTILVMRSQSLSAEEKSEFEKKFNDQGFKIVKGRVSKNSPLKWLKECRKAGEPQEVIVVTTPQFLSSRITHQAVTEGYEHSALLPN